MRPLQPNEFEALVYLEGVARGMPRRAHDEDFDPINDPLDAGLDALTPRGYAIQHRCEDDDFHWYQSDITSSGERALRIHREYLKTQ